MNSGQQHETAGGQTDGDENDQRHHHAAESGVTTLCTDMPKHEKADDRKSQNEDREHRRQQNGCHRVGQLKHTDTVQYQRHQRQQQGKPSQSARPGSSYRLWSFWSEGHGAARSPGHLERGMRVWLWLNSLEPFIFKSSNGSSWLARQAPHFSHACIQKFVSGANETAQVSRCKGDPPWRQTPTQCRCKAHSSPHLRRR